jgi:hypothetical protein
MRLAAKKSVENFGIEKYIRHLLEVTK